MREADIPPPALWLHCLDTSDAQIPIARLTGVATLGRHPDCDVHIPSQYVSRVHAKIYFDDGQWWVEDQDSSNGIFIDEKKAVRAVLKHQCLLQLGRQMSFKVFIDQR